MSKRRTFLITLLAIVLSFVCAFAMACSKKDKDKPQNVAVTSVTLDKESVELQLGTLTTVTLTATVAPDNATDKTVTWVSDNPAVATVADGVVTAVDVGTATITATAGGKSDSCTVRVIAESAQHTHTAGTEWQKDATNHWHLCTSGDGYEMDKGAHVYDNDEDATCNVCNYERTITPSHTHTADSVWQKDGTYHWHNCTDTTCTEKLEKAVHVYDNDEDATCNVCEYVRTVTPIDYTANGTYVLDIENAGATPGIYSWNVVAGGGFTTALDGTKYFKVTSSGTNYDYLFINVKLPVGKLITLTGTVRNSTSTKTATLGIALNSASTGTVDGLSNVAISSEMALNKTLQVTKEGVIKLGMYRATTQTGVEILALTVTISDINVESVALDKTNSALKVGESETLTATVNPSNAINTNIIWSSSDDTVASVVNGVVTAKKAGQVTITATSEADSSIKASCTYNITNVAPTSIELNRNNAIIAVGDTLNLTATVLPANTTIKSVVWSTSDDTIATVENGVVTAKKAGNVIVTVTSTEDASVKATCTIEVKTTIVYAESIALNYTNENLKVEDTLQLTATILPANTDDKSVTWESSNTSVATVDANGLVTIVGEGSAVITATSNSKSSLSAECTITATYQKYTVTFMSDGSNAGSKEVIKGQTTTAIELEKKGYAVEGWYESSTFSGSKFDFSKAITKDTTLYAKWIEASVEIEYSQGNLESATIEWSDANASGATVYYKPASALDSEYVAVDSELIRQIDADTARVDVIGLKGGENYTFKVKASNKGESIVNLAIKSYDRSGYAHFNYNKGVGAYKDDGTIKDNAIVLYVTDENKNTVELSYGGITVTGIGNILNTTGMDVGTGLNAKGGSANTNQGILAKLADANIPLVVRFIGCVSDSGLYTKSTFTASSTPKINGLTIFDSIDMGGSVGDNGHMARMKSAKDVTLEGIGEDAVIDGWGFHFMRSTSDKDTERGTSFEVRNLTFINTPEDAIGMEGTQGILSASGSVSGDSSPTSDILGSVERCWVHNNEFYSPSISGPAETDKDEGDGSCDFKRGQYFTCSYNYFEGCHKTNLVGSSDSSLQFNLTYHHNYWRFCKARGPLARRANIHMYNNVFEGQTDYAMNTRADCYIYSEYNLFYMCKNPQRVDGGAIKSYNDSFSSCIEGVGTIVTDKSQTVANNCQFSYRGIDYSKFDTNATLSYIPNGNYQLQESVTEARKYIEAYCGVTNRNVKAIEDISLSEMSVVPSGVTPVKISVPSTVTPGKISKTVYAFTIDSSATVTLSATGAVLVNEAGECLLTDSGSTVLEPGTYIVQATNFQPGDATGLGVFKDVTITSIAFEEYNSAELDAKLLAEYNAKATLVKDATIAYDTASYQLIVNAQNAYARLSADLKAQVTVPYSTVTSAYDSYVSLGEDYVEGLINAIGTVDANSGTAITKARNAYSQLIGVAPNATVSNYATLVSAEETYEGFKVQGLINQITALADPATATTEEAIDSLLAEYNSAKSAYEDLDETQKVQVTNYSKVTEGIATLTSAKTPYTVKAMIAELPAKADVTLSDGTAISSARKAYDALTEAQKTVVGDITKLTDAESALADLTANTIVAIFARDDSDNALALPDNFSLTGSKSNYANGKTYTYNGTTYSDPLKLESGTEVTFVLATQMKVTIATSASGKIMIDGVAQSSTSATFELTLEAGTHTIAKGDSMNLYYVILEAVA
ncbi:MAG: Ig-like domain-containing protein [Candidatus Coproplasma sp.]